MTRHSAVSSALWKMVLTTFLGAVMFSITLPSLALYLRHFEDPEHTEPDKTSFLGFTIASFSFGQLVASPIAGYWYDRTNARRPLLFSLVILCIANGFYSFAWNKWVVLLSRFAAGLGASNVTIARAFVSKICNEGHANISHWMAILSAVQAAGFVFGPIVGLAFAAIDINVLGMAINRLTSPGYAAIILSIGNAIPLFWSLDVPPFVPSLESEPLLDDHSFFVDTIDNGVASVNSKSALLLDIDIPIEDVDLSTEGKYDIVAAWVINLIIFCVMMGFAIFETIIVYFTNDSYKWDVVENGFLFSGCGVMVIVALIGVKPLQRKPSNPHSTRKWNYDDRTYLVAGLVLLVLSLIIASNPFFIYPLPMWAFLVAALLLFSPGLALSQTACFVLYSKILGPGSHGFMMGLQTALGCLSRIIGPICGTALYDLEPAFDIGGGHLYKTGRYSWIVTAATLALSTMLVIIYWNRFVAKKT